MNLQAQKTALLTTAFSLFMLVVYQHSDGKVVDYVRIVGKQDCTNLLKTEKNPHIFRYRNAAKVGLRDSEKNAYASNMYNMRCYPLNEWR